MSENGDYASVRAIEMRLIEEVGNQLKALTTAVQGVVAEVRDVRDKVIRLETQNSPERISMVEEHVRQLFERSNQMERERAASEQARTRAEADTLAAAAKGFADYKLEVERRMTKVEGVVVPVTVIGSMILSAAITAIIAYFVH